MIGIGIAYRDLVDVLSHLLPPFEVPEIDYLFYLLKAAVA